MNIDINMYHIHCFYNSCVENGILCKCGGLQTALRAAYLPLPTYLPTYIPTFPTLVKRKEACRWIVGGTITFLSP